VNKKDDLLRRTTTSVFFIGSANAKNKKKLKTMSPSRKKKFEKIGL